MEVWSLPRFRAVEASIDASVEALCWKKLPRKFLVKASTEFTSTETSTEAFVEVNLLQRKL